MTFSPVVRVKSPRLLSACLGSALLAATIGLAAAQDPPRETDSPVVQSGRQQRNDVFESLSQLRDLAGGVAKQSRAGGSQASQEAPLDNPPLPAEQKENIQRRLDLLKSLLERSQRNEQPSQPLSPARVEVGAETNLGDSQRSRGSDASSGSGSQANGAAGEAAPAATATDLPRKMIDGEPWVDQPVNKLELAHSLFQTGNFPMALTTYQSIQSEVRNPAEAAWLGLFIASCQRITGDLAAAESSYREVVANYKTAPPAKSAQWWLAYMDKRKTSRNAFQEIDRQLKAIETERERQQEKKRNGK